MCRSRDNIISVLVVNIVMLVLLCCSLVLTNKFGYYKRDNRTYMVEGDISNYYTVSGTYYTYYNNSLEHCYYGYVVVSYNIDHESYNCSTLYIECANDYNNTRNILTKMLGKSVTLLYNPNDPSDSTIRFELDYGSMLLTGGAVLIVSYILISTLISVAICTRSNKCCYNQDNYIVDNLNY